MTMKCETYNIFELEQDVENYIKFKYFGGHIRIKSYVVPHIFKCESDRKRTVRKSERSASIKRGRQKFVESVIAAANYSDILHSNPEVSEVVLHCMHEQITPQHSFEDTDAATVLCNLSNNILLKETNVKPSCSKSIGIQNQPKFRSKFVQGDLLTKQEVKYVSIASSPIKFQNIAAFQTESCHNTTIYTNYISSNVSLTLSGFSTLDTMWKRRQIGSQKLTFKMIEEKKILKIKDMSGNKVYLERLYEKHGALEFDAGYEAIYGMERYYTVQQCEKLRDKYKIWKEGVFLKGKTRSQCLVKRISEIGLRHCLDTIKKYIKDCSDSDISSLSDEEVFKAVEQNGKSSKTAEEE
ncbi:hypothetical protein FQA39_LY17214 [Lamprigera yunnana]|nr:hypothetical protein FQA39_LY17214 [Lamprigera yunnana]